MSEGARWRLLTPAHAPGAIAAFELSAASPAELDRAILSLTGHAVPVGASPVAPIAGVDSGVVARWSETCCHLMIHGGPAVVRELSEALTRAGLSAATGGAYPEASDEIEARMLDALAHAASPMAIDLLLAQPRLWANMGAPREPTARDRVLRRLIAPPLVAAIGPSNVGKSSLLNALAGRRVCVVADEPGTTTDHVGVFIDLAGLVVRCVDTPGVREHAPTHERHGAALAARVVERADLVLLCGDLTAPPPARPARDGQPALKIATRADLGAALFDADLRVSIHDAASLRELVKTVRDALVPPELVRSDEPWMFWDPAPVV